MLSGLSSIVRDYMLACFKMRATCLSPQRNKADLFNHAFRICPVERNFKSTFSSYIKTSTSNFQSKLRQTENFSIYRRHKLLAMSNSSPICLEWICIVIRPHVGDG